jgi:adenylate cyclase
MTGPEPDLSATIRLRDLQPCFDGGVPAVLATAGADGTPNVTYLSCVLFVDDEHVALSNQFFSKTSRNLAENPRGSLMMLHPGTYEQFRMALTYERTERRGPVFDKLRDDVEAVASLQGMQGVFRLRSADIYRVAHVEQVRTPTPGAGGLAVPVTAPSSRDGRDIAGMAELSARLSRCPDLDTLVDATVAGLAELFGYRHSMLLLLDEGGRHLYTIASHGYDTQGVGSEVVIGEGPIGMAAARCVPIRLGNLRRMARYSRRLRREYEDHGEMSVGREIPLPGLAVPNSCVAVPALALGQLVGALMVESDQPIAFGPDDEALLTVVATILGNALEIESQRERAAVVPALSPAPRRPADDRTVTPVAARGPAAAPTTRVRHFPVDGSTFLDDDYLIKGVAGRLLWILLEHHAREGRTDFTNREIRLDPRLELPEFRDNLDSRLILLKRRLDERAAPMRIDKTGRGRFRLTVASALSLDIAGPPA